jgi:hypothetical protein
MRTAIITSLFLVACAGTIPAQPPATPAEKAEEAKVTSDDYQEALAYQASLERIQDKFLREKHAIESCLTDGSAPKTCVKLKADYCQINVSIDTRGSWHRKPYC